MRTKSDQQDDISSSLRQAGNSLLLESLFEQSPLELFVIDEKFRIVKVSKYLAHQMCAQPVSELIGRSMSSVVGRKAWKKLHLVFKQAIRGDYVHDLHVILSQTSRVNVERHYLLTIYPLPNLENRKLIGGLFQEVTRQYAAEEKLLTYQTRLELAQNAGEVGIFEWDFVTNQVWSSPEEIDLFEFEPETSSLMVSTWLNKILPEDKQRVLKHVKNASQQHQKFDTEFRIQLANGQVRWIRGKGKFHYNAAGKAVQLVGVNYDITKRKREVQFLQFKADTSKILVSSLNAKVALQQTCDLATKGVADWCGVDLITDGTLKQSAFSQNSFSNASIAKVAKEQYSVTFGLTDTFIDVIKTQKAAVLSSEESPILANLEKSLHISSALILPIVVHNQAIGTISLFLTKQHAQYQKSDLELAQQLAARVSLFIENTTLYDQLKLERQHLMKLFENVPCIVYESQGDIDDPGYKMTFINSFAEELLGYPINTWLTVPKFGQSIIHAEDIGYVVAEARRAITSKTSGITRYRWRHKSGKYIWCEARFTPMVQNSKVIGIRGVITDISERMELELRKDEFIASASHELKTPLTSLKVFTQVLASSTEIQKNQKNFKYINRMEKEVDRLTKLVFDLLDLSKIQRGELPLTKKKMSLLTLLEEVVQNLAPTIPQKISFTGKTYVYITADEQRLNQVFTNLISNATKYSPDTSTIHITMIQKEHTVVVAVRDEGIGIAPEFQERVFQRFYRVFDEKDKTFPGLGMGLFISKTIIEHHHGKIWLESKPQEGTTFFVSLPIRTVKRRAHEKSTHYR